MEVPAFPPPVVQIDEETMRQQNLELEHAASMPLPTEDDDDDICLDCEQLRWLRVKSFVLFLHIGHHIYIHNIYNMYIHEYVCNVSCPCIAMVRYCMYYVLFLITNDYVCMSMYV